MKFKNKHLILGFSAIVCTLMIGFACGQEAETVSVLEDSVQTPPAPQIVRTPIQQNGPVIRQTPRVHGNNSVPSGDVSRSGLSLGGPNGVNAGAGQGLRVGPPFGGLQYGGGQILRYGTPNAGVRIGGGEGFRMGTPNIGVQYGGGQILRWGTPNAGVKVGGGEGFRIGTSNAGIKIGPGGLQIGRFSN